MEANLDKSSITKDTTTLWTSKFEQFKGLAKWGIFEKFLLLSEKECEELSLACEDYLLTHMNHLGNDGNEFIVDCLTELLWD